MPSHISVPSTAAWRPPLVPSKVARVEALPIAAAVLGAPAERTAPKPASFIVSLIKTFFAYSFAVASVSQLIFNFIRFFVAV